MNVLVVDRDLNVLRGIARTIQLEEDRWQVAFAYNADQARDLLDTYSFDAVIADWPNSTQQGMDLVDIMESEFPNCPLMVLPCNLDEKDSQKLQNRRITVLPKPTPWESIRDSIEKSVAAHQTTDHESHETKTFNQPDKKSPPASHIHELLRPRKKYTNPDTAQTF